MAYIGNQLQTAQPNYQIIDDISGSFDGTTTTFALQVAGVTPTPFPVSAQHCIISVGGVVQEPDPTGTNGFLLSGSNIVFSSAPSSGESFFGTVLAGADYINVGASFPDGSVANPSITFDQDLDTGLYRSASGTTSISANGTNVADFSPSVVTFDTGGSESIRIDSSGRLLVGTSTAYQSPVGTTPPLFQVHGTNAVGSQLMVGSWSTGTDTAPSLSLCRADSGAVGTYLPTIGSSDVLGNVRFNGSDGTKFIEGAKITASADGTWGNDDGPTKLVFSTTADGASSPTERMRITNDGKLQVSPNGSYVTHAPAFHQLTSTQSDQDSLYLVQTNTSFGNETLRVSNYRTNSSSFQFITCTSGNLSDDEFRLRGDGNAFADGSWNGGGADYAEYFEWNDGNLNEEDRRGISVILDDNKIRPAIDGEDPIGVISGNPSVVGDAAWNKWSGKYLCDDYGTYIQEDYEVINDEGETVVQQRRILNPAYDPDQEYINREDRPEWDCVGLMGKLRVRKGQPTGSRWIKMRDISDSVEEWLVR
jgi:hypothetical protein